MTRTALQDSSTPVKAPFLLDLVFAASWSAGGLHETVVEAVGGAAPPPGIESPRARLVPMLRRAPDGALWLVSGNEAVTHVDSGVAHGLSLAGAALDTVLDMAPLADGSVIVLGADRQRAHVLARLARSGEVLWRRTGAFDPAALDLPALRGDFTQLLTDSDGTVYLPGTRIAWQMAAVDAATGTTSVRLDLGPQRDDHPLLAWGRIFQPPSREPAPVLRTRALATGHETSAAAPALAELFARVVAGLPDGGALVQIAGQDLVWLRADGMAAQRLRIAGVVRTNGDLAAAVWEANALHVHHFQGGRATRSFHLAPVAPELRFDAVTEDGFFLSRRPSWSEAEEVLFFGHSGRRVPEKGFRNDPGRLIALAGRIDVTHPVVEPSGSLLFAGADAAGVFVVRLRLAR